MGFPCTPWSKRGSGLGFADPNAKPFFIGLSTVKVVKPKLFVWECVEGVAQRVTSETSYSDLEVLQGHLQEHVGDLYTLVILRNMSPLRMGFPMHRPRRKHANFARVQIQHVLAACSHVVAVLQKLSVCVF